MTTTTTRTSTTAQSRKARRSTAAPTAAQLAERDAARKTEVEQLLAQITTAVDELSTDRGWLALLRVAAKFHSYSLNNQLLILTQCPEATAVAGFRAWQALGRQVNKGEHGIRILRPITRRPQTTSTSTETGTETGTSTGVDVQTTTTGVPQPGTTGTAVGEQGKGTRRVFGYGGCSVFDVTQTDGPDLPAASTAPLSGPAPDGALEALTAHITARGWTVEHGPAGGSEAYANMRTRTIVCQTGRPGAHSVVSLAHEIAHTYLHDPADGFDYAGCRGQAEIEAEAIAYIVATALGVEAAEPYSATYLAGWANGDTSKVRAAADRVTTTARTLLAALDSFTLSHLDDLHDRQVDGQVDEDVAV